MNIIIDDGFNIAVINNKNTRIPYGCDVYEIPKGLSLWEGVTCIMQDCTKEQIVDRLLEDLSDNLGDELKRSLLTRLVNVAYRKGYAHLKNKNNTNAPYLITVM